MKHSRKNKLTILALALCCTGLLTLTFCSYHQAAKLAAAKVAPNPPIILDAGHGGEDGGATGKSQLPEKDLNLAITQMLQKRLCDSGHQVIMTRDSDVSLGDPKLSTIHERKTSDIHQRLAILQGTPGAIFISIHQNYFSESRYSGAQVFYSKNDTQSKTLAESIRASIVNSVQSNNDRQLKPATSSIYLLWHAKSPAVLVECGFLSNDSEAKLLNNSEYQEKIAQAIFEGINAYLTSPSDQTSSGD